MMRGGLARTVVMLRRRAKESACFPAQGCLGSRSQSENRAGSGRMLGQAPRLALALAQILFVLGTSTVHAERAESSGVTLRSFPRGYRAALTVASDTHATTVERFEAVHTLINTRQRIARGSRLWKILFGDPGIDRQAPWKDSLQGFGLPIADSLWLYDPTIGVFAGFDSVAQRPVPHRIDGVDFRDIVDRWIRMGWVDTLHTPGPGRIPREATAAGLLWLREDPARTLRIWSNHSILQTPTSVAPGGPNALAVVLKNTLKLGTALLRRVGLEDLARRVAVAPEPQPFPEPQRKSCRTLTGVVTLAILWLASCMAFRRLRHPVSLAAGVLLLLAGTGGLAGLRLDYAQGDGPYSPYYCADLLREGGFRYYWLDVDARGYVAEIPGRLALPEKLIQGRPSFLSPVQLDDGSRVLAFPRSYQGAGGLASLGLLTAEALADLVETGGTGILYTHWTVDPKPVFTAEALQGLERVRLLYEAGDLWVAPASSLLDFHFVRTFLEYGVRQDSGRCVVDIERVADPAGIPFVPTLEDLRGITFEGPIGCPIVIRIAGKPADHGALFSASSGDRSRVGFL